MTDMYKGLPSEVISLIPSTQPSLASVGLQQDDESVTPTEEGAQFR